MELLHRIEVMRILAGPIISPIVLLASVRSQQETSLPVMADRISTQTVRGQLRSERRSARSFVLIPEQKIECRTDQTDQERSPKSGPETGDAEINSENCGSFGRKRQHCGIDDQDK